MARYAIFPAKGDTEVVELVCADGSGAIGMFPATGKGVVLDCGHALVAGYKCTLGKADYASLTADLRKFDKKECVVSGVGQPLKGADGAIRLEVACSDGLPGYMISFSDPQTPKEAVACSFAGNCVLADQQAEGARASARSPKRRSRKGPRGFTPRGPFFAFQNREAGSSLRLLPR